MSFHDASRGPSAIAGLLVTVDGRRTARDGCTTQGPLFRHRTLCRAAPLISTSSPRFAAVRSALCFGISSSVSHCSLSLSPSFLLLRVCLSVEPVLCHRGRLDGSLVNSICCRQGTHAHTHAPIHARVALSPVFPRPRRRYYNVIFTTRLFATVRRASGTGLHGIEPVITPAAAAGSDVTRRAGYGRYRTFIPFLPPPGNHHRGHLPSG